MDESKTGAVKPDEDELEEVASLGTVWRVTRDALCHPLAFSRFREPARLKEARFYFVSSLGLLLVAGPLLGRLAPHSENTGEGSHTEVAAHVGNLEASATASFTPAPFGLEKEAIVFLAVIGVLLASLILNKVLSLVATEKPPRRQAIALCLYWSGFFAYGGLVLIAVIYGLAALMGGGDHASVLSFVSLLVFAILPMTGFCGLVMLQFLEWPRRLYRIAAWRYYAFVALVALAVQGGLALIGR